MKGISAYKSGENLKKELVLFHLHIHFLTWN